MSDHTKHRGGSAGTTSTDPCHKEKVRAYRLGRQAMLGDAVRAITVTVLAACAAVLLAIEHGWLTITVR